MPLPPEHLLDELATAYIQAVVAAAGATMSVSRLDYGIDGTIRQTVRVTKPHTGQQRFVPSGFPVDFQLKGTSIADVRDGAVRFDLKVRNYDQIVGRSAGETPLYLFLICFDSKPENWLTIDAQKLTLNASAYWWRDRPDPTGNVATVRLNIPTSNHLDVESMLALLNSSGDRSIGR
jgi:Domain of unknown function (DUF4365)